MPLDKKWFDDINNAVDNVIVNRQPNRVARLAFAQLINDDMTWLMKQPRSLERAHIEQLLRDATNRYYGRIERLR